MRHHIKGIIGIFSHISVRIGDLCDIAIAVVLRGGHVAQSIHDLGDEAPAVVLIQGDLILVHAVLGIHTM